MITRRQREVLDELSRHAAFSSPLARLALDNNAAEKLTHSGVLNKRYDTERGVIYWIRAENEPATGTSLLTGFYVHLTRAIATPSGRLDKFFIARAPYDGKGTTFRRLLRGWMRELKLRDKDLLFSLLGNFGSFEIIPADSTVFDGDYVIIDAATTVAPTRDRRH